MALLVRLSSVLPMAPHPTPTQPESLSSLWTVLASAGHLFQPLTARLRPTVKSRIPQTRLQSLYDLPPVEMLKSSLLPLELAPDAVATGPLLGWGSGCWAARASAEQSRESQAHVLFSPASHRLSLTLEKLWIFGLSPSNGALVSMPIVFRENQRVLG